MKREQVSVSEHLARQPADAAARAVTAVGLMTVGIIHVLEIQGQLSGAVWLTVGFCLLAVTAPACALWLLARPGRLPWFGAGLICLSAALGYVLTRSVAVPGDPGDVGNWLEPLGITALMVECLVVVIAVLALTDSALDVRPWPAASVARMSRLADVPVRQRRRRGPAAPAVRYTRQLTAQAVALISAGCADSSRWQCSRSRPRAVTLSEVT